MVAGFWRSRWPVAALIAGLALAGGAAAGYAVTRPPGHDYGAVPSAGSYHAAPAAPTGTAGRPAAGDRSGGVAVSVVHAPLRLRIPAIGVNAPVLPTGVEPGGGLAIPPDPGDVGWWAGGGFPGGPDGAVVLAGHIDSAASGPGALFRLENLRPGDGITLVADGGTYQYRVVALRGYAKSGLPAAAVFGQQVTARLVIISCGGPFDASTGHYLDNIVAYALPVSGSD